MAEVLKGKRVAILATNGFEPSELEVPRKALQQAGATAEVVSPTPGQIRGWNHTEWGNPVPVDVDLDRADPARYDALVLPGGVMNPGASRPSPGTGGFVRAFVSAKKPSAAICHGPWTLVNAAGVRGRPMTSWPSLQVDLENAGAEWVEEELVVDQGLVTGRKPADLPALNQRMIEEISEGRHERRASAARA